MGRATLQMLRLVKLLVFISEQEMKQLHKVCGTLYLRFIVNVPSLTPTQGLLMGQFYHRSGIEPWAKKPEHTSLVERFNNTLRQRVSRLVRKTLSFSKSVENHIGAIWYFIHAYNASLLLQDYPRSRYDREYSSQPKYSVLRGVRRILYQINLLYHSDVLLSR